MDTCLLLVGRVCEVVHEPLVRLAKVNDKVERTEDTKVESTNPYQHLKR